MQIRTVDPIADAAKILDIYSPFILNTAITFEETIPDLTTFQNRIQELASKFPYLVIESENKILGYCYATTHRERAAYRWMVETSIYLHPSAIGKNLASNLYSALCDVLSKRNFTRAYAIITLPNEASTKFHHKSGFETFAVFENAGYKMGQWHDVLWMRKNLAPFSAPSPEPYFGSSSI